MIAGRFVGLTWFAYPMWTKRALQLEGQKLPMTRKYGEISNIHGAQLCYEFIVDHELSNTVYARKREIF